jgi:hypothetical protein
MRIVFFALLLANLGIFAWSQWLSPASAPPAAVAMAAPGSAAPGGAPTRILLASERPAPAPASVAAALPTDGATPVDAAAATDAALSSGALEAGAAADGASQTGLPTVADAGSATVPGGATSPGSATGAGGVAATPAAQRCVSMGPFSDSQLTAQATAMLKQDGYQPRQRPANGPVPDGYMVMIGPLPSEAAQQRIVGRLSRGGLDDAFALPKLEEGYAVSVGLFSALARAERRVLAVERMGLKASVVERTRPGTVYWLDFDLKTAAGAPGAPDPLLKASDPAQKWQIVPCPEPRPVG